MGGATLETVRAYVDAQGTEEHARKAKATSKTKPSACPPPGATQVWQSSKKGNARTNFQYLVKTEFRDWTCWIPCILFLMRANPIHPFCRVAPVVAQFIEFLCGDCDISGSLVVVICYRRSSGRVIVTTVSVICHTMPDIPSGIPVFPFQQWLTDIIREWHGHCF